MNTFIAYLATIAAVILTVTMLLQALIGGLVGRAVGPLLGALVGGVVVWFGIDLLWLRLEGDHVPMSVLATAIAVLFAKSAISKDKLTQQSKWMMAGEAWSIVLIGVYLAVVPDGIRWY